MLTDQVEKGRNTIKEHFIKALKPQTVTDTIILPDGTRKEKVKTYINQQYIDRIKRFADKYDVQL